jgi:acyl-coenzyme A synthetase/AMP-(fatty) acid ligase
MSGVPYTWELLRRLRFMRMDLPSVKTMTQAGGKLNAEIAQEYIQWAKSQDKRFIVMYGQTEATARMSYLPWEKAEEKYASIGVAIPGGEFSLAEDGELIYKGENVSMGYAECAEDLMKDDENHGILHTGDMSRVDEDGYYYITGRKKRFVKIWGNRCNLDQIEQMVKTITTSCACAGVDDHITVFVTKDELEKDIKDLLAAKTGLNPIAFAVKVIEAIPVTASGKIDYPLLQEWL